MKKTFFSLGFLLFLTVSNAQSINDKLRKAFGKFESDSQMKHGIASLYVIDARTGEVIFDKNSQVGLVPASTQKIITSVTAFELLGKDFRYQTQLASEKLDGKTILSVVGNGDPTLGSWRWDNTTEERMLKRWVKALQDRDLKKVDQVLFETGGWNAETIPDGWTWQDIGNYYGAGATVFNWRENQYDIHLRSGVKTGDKVSIVKTMPFIHGLKLESQLLSAGRGTGDKAYVYYPFGWKNGVIRGTIPINESNFKISASLPNPFHQFLHTLADNLKELDIKIPREPVVSLKAKTDARALSVIITEYSPPLDSIIYWFNRKSVNLYGEALIKTIAVQKTGFAVTDSGVSVLKRFWKEKGIHPDELNMFDGSGLSPLNRVTTHAQVEILKFAKTRNWYPAFYGSLPEYNGMKIKSGTISDVKGFCGYHTSRDGREYIFSMLVNNYGGRTGSMVSKMYEVLNVLK